jgi:ABC-2 type transport system ATP-binding protein
MNMAADAPRHLRTIVIIAAIDAALRWSRGTWYDRGIMLRVEKVSKSFGTLKAVDEISFEVKDGEIVCLIGPNGAGKTTIIKSTAGLFATDGGAIFVDDKDVAKHPQETKAMIGYIPDDPAAWPGMTGEEFLHFIGTLFGVAESERMARIAKLLPIFGLQGIEKNYFETYSRGNKQKFSILAALLHMPRLLLIDEPIVGLDPLSARRAKDLFIEYAKKENAGILIVTHTLPFAEEVAQRIGVMSLGKLIAVGTIGELRRYAKLQENASLEEVYLAITGNSFSSE